MENGENGNFAIEDNIQAVIIKAIVFLFLLNAKKEKGFMIDANSATNTE